MFKALRSRLIFWILDKWTQPEMIPLTVWNAELLSEGDLLVINAIDPQSILGSFVRVDKSRPNTAHFRLYRRPK